MTDKTVGITRINDITADWVKENFDLDAERLTTKHETYANRTDYIADVSSSTPMTLDDFWAAINKWLDVEFEENNLPTDARKMIRIRDDDDYDYCGCDRTTTILHEVYVEYELEETDAEVITRIKNRERAKVRRRNEKAKKVAAEAKKVADEKKLMRQLMKKYKDEL